MKITIILCMISLSVYASRSWAQQESAWALSANPVSISYVPKDSAMEAGLSYLIHQAALPASDQPDQTQTYRAYVSGNRKLGLLWLAGGIDWSQSLLEGRKWNLLSQPDYLITPAIPWESHNASRNTGSRTSGLRLIPENQGRDRWRLYSYKQRRSLLLPYLPWDGTLNPDIRRYVYEQVRRRFGASSIIPIEQRN